MPKFTLIKVVKVLEYTVLYFYLGMIDTIFNCYVLSIASKTKVIL